MHNGVRVFAGKIEEVHSGDDFIILVDLGIDGLLKRTRVRLSGVDAPNAYKASADTEAGRIRDEIKAIAPGRCTLTLISEGKGGWIAIVSVERAGETICLNTLLQNRGYVYTPVQKSNSTPRAQRDDI